MAAYSPQNTANHLSTRGQLMSPSVPLDQAHTYYGRLAELVACLLARSHDNKPWDPTHDPPNTHSPRFHSAVVLPNCHHTTHKQSSCRRSGWVQIVLCSADAHFPIRRSAGRVGIGLPIPRSGLPIEPGTSPRNLDALVAYAVGLLVKERPSQWPILDQPGMQGYRAASLPSGWHCVPCLV